MPSVEIQRDVSPKMTRHYRQKWQLQALGATAVKVASTLPTCTTDSRSYSYNSNRHVLSVRGFGALYSEEDPK